MDKEEFGMWKLHPCTQALMRQLELMIYEGIEELASGTHSQDVGKTHLCIGKINAYKSIRNLDIMED